MKTAFSFQGFGYQNFDNRYEYLPNWTVVRIHRDIYVTAYRAVPGTQYKISPTPAVDTVII